MRKSISIAVAMATLLAGAARAEQIVNGGFETGDFTGWTVADPSGFTLVESTFTSPTNGLTYTPHSGTFFAALGAEGADGTLSQTFADVAGKSYEASFYLASDGLTPNDFAVTGPGGLSLPTMTDVPASPYTLFFGFFTGSGSDTITFTSRDDPGFFSLDDVSVTATVPEPATWAPMIWALVSPAPRFAAAGRSPPPDRSYRTCRAANRYRRPAVFVGCGAAGVSRRDLVCDRPTIPASSGSSARVSCDLSHETGAPPAGLGSGGVLSATGANLRSDGRRSLRRESPQGLVAV